MAEHSRSDHAVMPDQDFFQEGEAVPEGEPAPWRPPVHCPRCQTDQTRFVELRYEMSVYACELCGAQFEVEEPL